jgi:tRNA-dihydrouridine synthase B
VKKFWDNSNGMCGADMVVRQAASLLPVPKVLSIGTVTISPATVLAPMAGVTDTVFRRFIRNLGGCGLIMTEFTSADGVLRKKDQKAKRYLHFYEDEHPISAQLFGSDANVMAEAARMVEGLGFDLVDLNLGCPAKKVVKCNGGSGLLRDLPAIGKIFEAVRAAVKIPFTVKFRAGWNDEARWEWIAAINAAVKIPVIGNGDIRTPEDACAMVTQTGCDAVMIGRTAPSNPWIFRQIEQYCAAMNPEGQDRGGHDFSGAVNAATLSEALAAEGPYLHPSEADRYQMIRTYFRMLIEEELPDAVGKMKQFGSWFTHGVPGGAGLRKAIYESKNAPEILSRVEDFFETRLCGASALAREV